jgi:anti-sigma factor RsiW
MSNTKHPAGHILQAFHDKELDQPAAAEVKAHCGLCDECRSELAELGRMSTLLSGAPAPELPRTVWHRVRPGRPQESRLKPVFGFAAGAAGIVLGILLGPIDFNAETTGTDLAWSENVTVWDNGASTSLLNVFQYEQE